MKILVMVALVQIMFAEGAGSLCHDSDVAVAVEPAGAAVHTKSSWLQRTCRQMQWTQHVEEKGACIAVAHLICNLSAASPRTAMQSACIVHTYACMCLAHASAT